MDRVYNSEYVNGTDFVDTLTGDEYGGDGDDFCNAFETWVACEHT